MPNEKTVLMIEDSPASVKWIQSHLEKLHYRVVIAESGFLGLKKARDLKPDLILMDIMLPDLDGHKLCRMIKFDKELKHIPVAMFTSRDTEEDAEMAKKMGANAFILKSTRIEIILNILERLLEKKESPRP
jgi:DNA-binding response OmpR family regulator